MLDFYNFLPASEKNRVEALEVFDEFEEFELKCSHYNLLCATSINMTEFLTDKMFASIKQNVFAPSSETAHLKPLRISKDSTVNFLR